MSGFYKKKIMKSELQLIELAVGSVLAFTAGPVQISLQITKFNPSPTSSLKDQNVSHRANSCA